MASIIEKETGQAGERDMIGGVLVNRLRIGMRLQVDPTIDYGLGTAFDGNLKRSHLAEDGPYNATRGLPPTPIAMPGLASLRAAVRPGKTDAMYYVSRNDGSSHFSRTLEEHNRAVTRYQLRAAMSMRGKLTLEGVDGAGKSTHQKFVADLVATRAPHVIQTREPGGTDLAERLREAILTSPMTPEVETLLLFAARADHVARVIGPRSRPGRGWSATALPTRPPRTRGRGRACPAT